MPCQDCTPSAMLWQQACPWQVQELGPFSAGSWKGPTPFLLQLQPQERWFVTGGARTWDPMAASISQAAPAHWLCSAEAQSRKPLGTDCFSRHGAGPTSGELKYPPSPFPCWGRADFFIQNCKVSCPPQPKCPQGREPLFRPSEQGTHKLGDDEGSPLLLLNKNHMVGMCVY